MFLNVVPVLGLAITRAYNIYSYLKMLHVLAVLHNLKKSLISLISACVYHY